MNHAWTGPLAEAVERTNDGTLCDRVLDGFVSSYGRNPADSEVNAWRGSLPGTVTALSGKIDPGCQLVVEYRLPFNGQRADLVVLGRSNGKSAAHVVELKHWAESGVHPRLDHFVNVAGSASPHPSYQAANYAGKLRYFHSAAQNWRVTASARVSDRSADRHTGLRDGKYVDLWTAAPVFLPGEDQHFARHVAQHVSQSPTDGDIRSYFDGSYKQSLQLLEGLKSHQKEIRERAMAALAVSGWGLSEEQLLVYDEILEAARLGSPATFLLSGGPGSGKTLLGVHLLLGLAAIGKRTVLAVRNNRLSAALKEVLDFRPFGVGGMIKFFSTAPYGKNGVEDSHGQIADVLVCDEGQRLTLSSDNVFRRAPLTIVLYDESQMLNIEEGGSRENLLMRSQGAGREAQTRILPTLHRCRGGAAYVEWVERMLADPGSYPGSAGQWAEEYGFGVVSSPLELVARLRSHLTGSARVALVASFTRSSGRAKPGKSHDLGLVRIPEVLPQTLWLMDPQKDYVPFWVHGRSNELTHCASIYGSQGFETDYAGVVWGDDLVIRSGKWTVGNPDNCFDTAPGVTKLGTLMRTQPTEALRLLKNRYRILLTRGILGTFVYCEDPETQQFLERFGSS